MIEGGNNIPETEREPILIDNGDIVIDKKGKYGIILGTEKTSHGEMVKVKFSDYEGFYPKNRLSKDIQIIPRQQFEVPKGETLEHHLRQLEDEVKYKISKETLRSYIEQHQPHNIKDLCLVATDSKQEKILTEILQGHIKVNYVFRSDKRHPCQNKFDKSENLTQGVFKIGFQAGGGGYGANVSVTADFSRALWYPREEDMPANWDKKKYIYFINSEIVLKTVSSLDPNLIRNFVRNDEIECKGIPAESILYALFIDGQSNKLLKIFKNPKSSK